MEYKISLGRSTGIIYFSNSIGCTCGSLITGFVAIPLAGWYASLVLISMLAAVMGSAGFVFMRFQPGAESQKFFFLRHKYRFILIIFIVIPLILFSVSDKKIKYKLATGKYSPKISILSYKEGATGVAAISEDEKTIGVALHVYSNGEYMSSLPSNPRHTYLANLPRMQNDMSSVLLLGLGAGRSLADLLSDERVKSVVAVDWSREIVKLAGSEPATYYNRNSLADNRVKVEMADARKVVSSYAQKDIKFDAIIDNLCFPHWPGAVGVKSIRFFWNIKKILKPNGFYYHINNFNEEKNLILFTLTEVFDYVAIHNEKMVICGRTIYSPSESQVAKILSEKGLLKRSSGFFIPKSTHPHNFYPFFRKLIVKVVKRKLGESRPLTDEIPSTEYFISIPLLLKKIKNGLS